MTKTMKAYYAKAYPKINITLKIGEKIGNLHTLQSRFCLVEGSLYDSFLIIKEPLDNEVLTQKDLVKKLPQRYTTFSETTKQHNAIQCYLYGNFDCKLEDNLIYKAYMLLAQHIDSNINPCSIHILVDKRIPVGGGLGGGSVNAALMLLLLNELFNLNCSKEILYQYAKALGSDVAFFLMIYTQNSTHITPYFYVEQNLSKGDLDSILFKQTQDENLDSNICHVERSETSKDLEMIKESKQDSNIESKKDISCLRTRTSEALAHTCKYDKNLDSIFLDSLKQKRQDHSINFLGANVYGTGEIIEPFYEKLPHFLIHCNAIACNTGAVYKEFAREKQAIKDSKKENIDLQKDSITLLQTYDIYTLNDLYKPACNLYELEAIAKGLHKKYGNVYFSGSGSSFFSINHDIKE
ncbi:GHMP family kinase ATP-binding protein [Helicobacter bilis]|uniref:GHMP family kinase ATP-binding protein n=1 Tax=Helicobacter bilis TaxID=37372 RepID=UPI0025581B5E|nr:4-(cytidine 5'-diphospho)-2-C-methyl-D-erythritol kinase [Helicobacter bilis]